MGAYQVLLRTECTFLIQRGTIVDRVNRDRVTAAAGPAQLSVVQPLHRLGLLTREDVDKNTEVTTSLVDELKANRAQDDGSAEFLVEFNGPYKATWEPRRKIPEELISRYITKVHREDRDVAAR